MNTFNSNIFIKSLKKGYEAIPVLQGSQAAKVLVADSIKANGFNPEDVLSFIYSKVAPSSTLSEEEWKTVIATAIKRGGSFGQALDAIKSALKGKLSKKEMFNLAASCCGVNPVLLSQEICCNQMNWSKVLETLLKTPVAEPVTIKKAEKKEVVKKTTIKVSKLDPRSKSITLIKDGVKKEWASYRDCEKELNAGHGTVSQLKSGKLRTIKGWILYQEEKVSEKAPKLSSRRAVSQMKKDKKGHLKVVNTFPSLTEAARATGIPHSSISKVITGTYQSAGGFVWKAAEAAA